MRSLRTVVCLLLVSATLGAAAEKQGLSLLSFDQTVDRVVERERTFVATMKRMHPLAETYIQNLREDSDHNVEPVSDQYFLGRLDLNAGPRDAVFQKRHAQPARRTARRCRRRWTARYSRRSDAPHRSSA